MDFPGRIKINDGMIPAAAAREEIFWDELRALAPFSFPPFPFPAGWLWDCWGRAALDALSGKLSPKVPLDLAVGSSTGAKKSISKILMEKNRAGGVQGGEIWLLRGDW